MEGEDGGGGAAQAELCALRVRFECFRLGCNAAHAGPLAAGWSAAHDAGLLTALRELSELGGLPNGAAKKSPSAWSETEAKLQAARSALLAAGGAKLDVDETGHKCTPGYDVAGCKQVRGIGMPRAKVACGGTRRAKHAAAPLRRAEFTPLRRRTRAFAAALG